MKRMPFAWMAVTWRTSAAVLTDFGAFTLLLAAGVLYSFFYPAPYLNEVLRQVPVAVVDLDNSDLSRTLVRLARASPDIQVRLVTGDAGAARRALQTETVYGQIVIPRDFARDLAAGRQAHVTVAGNAAWFLTNKMALQGLATAAGAVGAGAQVQRMLTQGTPLFAAATARDPLALDIVPMFNTSEGYASYLVPMVAVLIVHQTLLLGVGLLLGSWREGSAAPPWQGPRGNAGAGSAVGGMVAAFAGIGLVHCLYWFGFVFWFHDFPLSHAWARNLGDMVAFSALFSLASACLAVALGQCFSRREHAILALIVTSIPLLFLSGGPWPVESLPVPLQWLRWAVPTTPGIQGLVAINQMGATLADVRPELAGLCVQAVLYALIARWRFSATPWPPPASASASV